MHGRFVRTYWYERGIEHGNPYFNGRFRVNAPEASLHPQFMYRDEVQGNGMMQIRIDEDLAQLGGAALYCEIWGGHPGTINKRVSINGRSTYALPEVGTAAGHCTHQYPTVQLKRTDLVNGYNAIQYGCDQGSCFWGHFIVDNACLRLALKHDHPALVASGLDDFDATVGVRPHDRGLALALDCPSQHTDRIARRISSVDFSGTYDGYDENGSTHTRDWHGFTKDRLPVAHLGTVSAPPFTLDWDTTMLPAQSDVSVRAAIWFKDQPDLVYETSIVKGLSIPERDSLICLLAAQDQPAPFWSRAGREMRCALDLDVDSARLDRAVLHIVVWDGGRGGIEVPLSLNNRALPVAGEGNHDVLYRQIEIDPALLRRGSNNVRLLSDTEHHGIEVLRPGPALMIRYKED